MVLDSSPHKDCFHFHRSHLFKPINQPRECTQSNVTICWESGEVKYELILIHFILGIRLRPSPVMSACPPSKKTLQSQLRMTVCHPGLCLSLKNKYRIIYGSLSGMRLLCTMPVLTLIPKSFCSLGLQESISSLQIPAAKPQIRC